MTSNKNEFCTFAHILGLKDKEREKMQKWGTTSVLQPALFNHYFSVVLALSMLISAGLELALLVSAQHT